jgi:structure-specific endonuclease subunit SLX1
MSWNVYLLVSPTGTYVGATVDLDRRLRQHNGLISGGAKATTSRSDSWIRACHFEGFASERDALQFEWAWKHHTKSFKGGSALERRFKAASSLLSSVKATNSAIPFANLEEPLRLILETESATSMWSVVVKTTWDHVLVFNASDLAV